MAQMANGANFVKGTFTVPNNINSYTIDFGKTINQYLFVVEMTDESKKTLMEDTSDTNPRCFIFYGLYPKPSINNMVVSYINTYYRIVPSTGGTVSATLNEGPVTSFNETSIVMRATEKSGNRAAFIYKGYSYNYYICEIK